MEVWLNGSQYRLVTPCGTGSNPVISAKNYAGISASGPGDVPFKHVTRVRIPFPVPVGLSVTCQKLSKLVGRLVVQDA